MKRYTLHSLLLVVCLFVFPVGAAVNLKFNGDLGMRGKYTPEEGLKVERKLYLDSNIQVGSRLIGTLGFKGYNQDGSWQPIFGTVGDLSLVVDRISVAAQAPLVASWPSCLTTLGDVELNYSPYIFRVDDSLRYRGRWLNPRKRGIAISDLKAPGLFLGIKTNMSASLLWDQGTSERYLEPLTSSRPEVKLGLDGLIYAARFEGMKGTKTIAFTTANFLGDATSPLSADTENADRYALEEQAFLIELQQSSQRGISWQIIGGRNNRDYRYQDTIIGGKAASRDVELIELKSTGDLLLAQAGYKFGSFYLAVGYQYLEPEFDPLYRDRTPRYDEESKLLSWNPLDELATIPGVGYGTYEQLHDPSGKYRQGRQGGFINLKSDLGLGKVEGTLTQFRSLTGEAPSVYRLLQAEFEVPFSCLILEGTVEAMEREQFRKDGVSNTSTSKYLLLDLIKPLIAGANYNVAAVGRYEYCDAYETPEAVAAPGAFVDMVFVKGWLTGLKGRVGLSRELKQGFEETTSILVPQARFSYKSSLGVSLYANWALPNREDHWLYDRCGREFLGEDNLLEARFEIKF